MRNSVTLTATELLDLGPEEIGVIAKEDPAAAHALVDNLRAHFIAEALASVPFYKNLPEVTRLGGHPTPHTAVASSARSPLHRPSCTLRALFSPWHAPHVIPHCVCVWCAGDAEGGGQALRRAALCT